MVGQPLLPDTASAFSLPFLMWLTTDVPPNIKAFSPEITAIEAGPPPL